MDKGRRGISEDLMTMASLFGAYIKEISGKSIVESDKGFATFYFINDICYIEDIYVHPDHRKSDVASQMADQIVEIAKDVGCTRLAGTVIPSNNHATRSLKVLLAYGFTLDSAGPNLIALTKEI